MSATSSGPPVTGVMELPPWVEVEGDVPGIGAAGSPAGSPGSRQGPDREPMDGSVARTTVWGWLLAIAGVAVVLVAGWWASNSPLFDLRTLHISGRAHLTRNDVARLGDLDADTNVLWFAAETVEERIERDPWVRSAEVTRDLPSTVWVRIEERIPVAVVDSGVPYLVAADGTILGRAGPKTRLPVLRGSFGSLEPGARIDAHHPALVATATFERSLLRSVVEAWVDPQGALTLELKSGILLLYGDAGRSSEKSRVAMAVLSWAYREGIEVGLIDVRAPRAPALVSLTALQARSGGRPPAPASPDSA